MSAPLPRESGPEAGRELDALVAEKVMGWLAVRMGVSTGPCRWNRGHAIPKPLDTPKGKHPGAPRHGGLSSVPCYSTSIADAWLVVEKMTDFDTNRDEPWWSVAIFHAQRGQVGCRVYACQPGHNIFDAGGTAILGDNEGVIAEAVGRSAPHAICLAALAALAVPPTPGGREP